MSHPPSIWRASLTSPPSDDLRAIIAEYVELQRNYLRNPLPVSPSICPVCRGVRSTGYALCFPCATHRELGSGALADIVLPVSYSPRNGQHHHNLRTYKAAPASQRARRDLLALLLHFLHRHLPCVNAQIGGSMTHTVTVPSTSGRTGPHPLSKLIGSRLGMPTIATRVNPSYGPGEREFHPDWFAVSVPAGSQPVRVLLLDDTWTTGARAQSLAYALKMAGAVSVATVVLGRHVNPDYAPSKQLLSAIREPIFDPAVCAAETGT